MVSNLRKIFFCLFFISSCGPHPHGEIEQQNQTEKLIIYPIEIADKSVSEKDALLVTYTFQYSENCADGNTFSGPLTKVFSKSGVACHFKITSLSDGSNTFSSGTQAEVDFDGNGNITSASTGFYSSGATSKAIYLYHIASPSSFVINMVDASAITPNNNSSVLEQQVTLPSSGRVSAPCGILNTCTFTNFIFSSSTTNCDSVNKKITLHMVNTLNSSDTADVIFTYAGSFGVTTNSLRYTTLGTSLIVQVTPLDICQTNPANILATNGWSLNESATLGINSYSAVLVYNPLLNSSAVNSKLSSGASYTTTYSIGTGGTLALSSATLYSHSFVLPIP